jgi:hypothetical protein
MEADRPRAQSLNRRALIAATSGLVTLAFIYSPRVIREMRDFEVYWTAAARALERAPLYRTEDGHFQFKYLPAFAIASAPLALMPLETAKRFWFLLSVTLIPSLVALSVLLLPELRRPPWIISAAVIVIMGKFYGHELILGQVNLLFAVVVGAGIVAMRHSLDALAGGLFVAAVVVKPYAILFLPWLLFTRGSRPLASVVIGGICVAAAPVGLYGATGTVALYHGWWATVTASTAPNLTNPDNVSVAAMFARMLGEGNLASVLAAVTSALLVAIACLAVISGRGIERRESLEGALLLTLVPLLSPQGWDYVCLVATPAIALLVNYDHRLPAGLRAVAWLAMLTIGFSLFDLMGRERYAIFMSWSAITICFLVVIATLVTIRRRRVA